MDADPSRPFRIALTGDVALDLLAPYFRKAGYETYVPAGFGTWRQEVLDPASPLHRFKPDALVDVTAYDKVLEKEVPGFYDPRLKALAACPYSLAGIQAIVDEFTFSRLAAPKKILAVDADNTLWKGILSEDGEENLAPYTAFQRGLLDLRARGVVLVLLSKNDPFEFRADMPLKTSDFAVCAMNWSPKAGNLANACHELNLSTDSVVFVDDNPFECAQMRAHLPEVAVPPFAPPPTPQLLRRLNDYFFSAAGRTEEDRLRAADYDARKSIPGLSSFASAADYLKALELRVVPGRAEPADLDRLAQMAGKTNQFNATTRRRTRDEFAALLADPSKAVFVFRASDKFSVQGLVCYVVFDLPTRHATDFVMSCRAMGRTLEYFVYRYLTDTLGFAPVLDYVPSAKNKPFKDFLDGPKTLPTYYTVL